MGVGELHPEPVRIIPKVEATPRNKSVVPLETKHGYQATKHQQVPISGSLRIARMFGAVEVKIKLRLATRNTSE